MKSRGETVPDLQRSNKACNFLLGRHHSLDNIRNKHAAHKANKGFGRAAALAKKMHMGDNICCICYLLLGADKTGALGSEQTSSILSRRMECSNALHGNQKQNKSVPVFA